MILLTPIIAMIKDHSRQKPCLRRSMIVISNHHHSPFLLGDGCRLVYPSLVVNETTMANYNHVAASSCLSIIITI